MAEAGKGGVRDFVLDNLVVAVAQLLMKLRALLALPLIVKTLGTEGFGLWSQVLSVVTFGGAVLGANLHLPLVRFIAGKTEDPGRVYITTLACTLTIGGGGALLFVPWASSLADALLGGRQYGQLIKAAGVLLVLHNVRLLNVSLYRATGRFVVRSAVEFSSAMLELVGILLVLRTGRGIDAVVEFMVAWNGFVAFGTTIHALKIVGLRAPSGALARQSLVYALPLLPGAAAWWAIDRSDRFVIGHYFGPKEVGVYSAAYALGALVLNYQMPFQMTLMPQIARLWDTDRPRARRYIEVCTKAFLLLAIPTVVGMPIVAPLALRTLANEEIASRAALVATVVGIGVVLQGVAIMQTQIFHGARRTATTGIAMTFAAVLNIGLTFLLVPRLGIAGGAWATACGYGALTVALVVLARPILRVDHQLLFVVKSAASAGLMVGVLRLLHPTKLSTLLLALIPAVAVYFLALFLLGGVSPDERAALGRLRSRKR